MTGKRPSPEAIQAAGETYGAILADPERREQIRAAVAAHEATIARVRPVGGRAADGRRSA